MKLLSTTAALLFLSAQAMAERPVCEEMDSDYYFQLLNQGSDQPLAVGDTGQNVYQGIPGPGTDKNWHFVATSDKYYHIVAEDGGEITVEGERKENGANIFTEAAGQGGQRHEWCFIKREGEGYEIQNRFSQFSMDATLSGGYNVLSWGYWGGANQEWRVKMVKPADGSTPNQTPAPTRAGTPAPTPRGDPTIDPTTGCAILPTGKYLQLLNKWSGLPLAVEGSSMIDGANILQGTSGLQVGENEVWYLEASTTSSFYRIINKNSGQAVSGMWLSRLLTHKVVHTSEQISPPILQSRMPPGTMELTLSRRLLLACLIMNGASSSMMTAMRSKTALLVFQWMLP